MTCWPGECTKSCLNRGMTLRAVAPTPVGVDGQVAPDEDLEALLGGDRLDRAHGLALGLVVVGQERDADGVRPARRQVDALLGEHGAEELVRDLGEDAGAVAGVRLGAGGAAVLEVLERGDGLLDDLVGLLPRHLRDEGDAAGVLLELGVVEPLGGGDGRPHGHSRVVSLAWSAARRCRWWVEQGTTLAICWLGA